MLINSAHPAIALANQKGLVRARDLALVGAAGGTLQQLLQTGSLVRVGRGVYAPAGRTHLHGLTTQSPHEVWVAVGQKARAPNIEYPPLHVVRMTDVDYGVATVAISGVVRIPVTDVAKTIADCFKFRNKIGLDVALEALRDAWQQKKVTMDELWHFGQICRVQNVMRPYLEGLTA